MKSNKLHIFIFLATLALCSCNTTQFLDKSKDEKYLSKNEIKLDESDGNVKNKTNLISDMSQLYVKKSNTRMFGTPRQWYFFASQDTFDMTNLGRAWRRWQFNRSEEPVYFDSASVEQTRSNFVSYLKSRGYFFADVKYEVKFKKAETKAHVIYTAIPDGRFKIDSLEYQSKDSAIMQELSKLKPASLLKPGSPIDVKLYDQEVARITKHMRDNGYAYFYPQYITTLEGFDSSNVERTAGVRLKVLAPPGKQYNVKYTIGNIYIFPDYDPSFGQPMPDTLIDGLFFGSNGRIPRVKPNILASSIFIRSGEIYNQEAVDNTVRQLSSLEVFRPPTIRIQEDSLNPGNLNIYLFLTSNPKWDTEQTGGLLTTERAIAGRRNLIGANYNPSVRNRNFLRGAELFDGSLNFVAEFNFFDGTSNLLNALDFRWQNELYFPRFTDYFGLWRQFKKWNLTSENFNRNLKQKATSHASAGYNYLDLLENYQLHFVNFSYGYDVPVSLNHKVSINHFGIDVVLSNITKDSPFYKLLETTPALKASFDDQLITGFLFRNINFQYSSPPKTYGGSWFFRGYFDLSGLEIMTANGVYNAISGSDESFALSSGLEFSHYWKLELEGKHYWELGVDKNFVVRLLGGVAMPYYKSSSVPYVKQFFAGGPYDIRGWYTRELGPGLYKDDKVTSRNLFYQTGDIKFVFNLEYRFLLMRPFGFFNLYSAFFLDGGNIWTSKLDTSREGSRFAFQRKIEDGKIKEDLFLKETALATGLGFRMDFTYLLLRLDLGTPIRNNYPSTDPNRNNSYFIDPKNWEMNGFWDFFGTFHKNIKYQLAIDYPF